MHADQILVLSGGAPGGLRHPPELISRPGIYREIYDIPNEQRRPRAAGKGGDDPWRHFDEQEYTKSFDLTIWKRLGSIFRPYRACFVGMFAFNALTAAVDVALPLLQRFAIANFIEESTLAGIVPYGAVYLAVILLQALSVVLFARNSCILR